MSITHRVSDQHMPRGMEILDAYVARRGPVTLTEDQLRVLIGRATSMVMSGTTATLDASADLYARQIGAYTAQTGGTILRTLGVDPKDSAALLKQMHADLDRINPEGAP